jgi:hypothetical protein
VAYDFVGADGTYKIPRQVAGSYKIFFGGAGTNAVPQWYNNAASSETSTPVTVTAGQDIAGINATLQKVASISGKITAQPGVNLANAGVLALPAAGSGTSPGSASVGADGTYTVSGLAAGSYKLTFGGGDTNALAYWYLNASSFETATPVTVTAGQAVTGINVTLKKAASISGKITTPPGVSPARVYVTTVQTSGAGSTSGGFVHADGTYKISGLEVGSYKICLEIDRAILQCYTNATSVATATPVPVAAGQDLTGINFVLAAMPSVLAPAPVPTITGVAKVGSILTAVPGTWGPAPVALTYQWKANGVAIAGATAATYKLAAAQAGKTLTVTVTGTKAGFTTAAKTSTATASVAPGTIGPAPVPTITGTAKVGSILTAVPGTWGPAPVALTYQWKANGVAIAGATAATYKLAAAQAGKTLTVTVTGTKAGFTTAAKTSTATASVVL